MATMFTVSNNKQNINDSVYDMTIAQLNKEFKVYALNNSTLFKSEKVFVLL
jgi:hypothetical protein